MFTLLVDGVIHPQVRSGTTVSASRWAQLFSQSGIPTVVDEDMQSWLRSHAAMVVPLMAASVKLPEGRGGLTWSEARAHARGFAAGARAVRATGSSLRPTSVARLLNLPLVVQTAALWAFSRTAMLRDLGKLGPTEARMLIDMMHVAAPDEAAHLLTLRPL